MRRFIVAALALVALVYAGDYLSVRFRIPRGRNPFGSVTVQVSYSVMKKDGKPDYYFQPPQAETCVRSLFPHLGYTPCWYLNRHKNQQINM
jgi:hypothetical protein